MATAPVPGPAPAVAEVEAIAALGEPVLRNLRITDCYHRLSLALTERVGQCANWCTFATWASRQAGSTIRGEDMLAKYDALTHDGFLLLEPVRSMWRALVRRGVFYPETRLGRVVREIHTPFDAFERASDAVSRGNLKVFTEIGREFARYLESCPPGDEDALERFVSGLQPGDPPEGQDRLRDAFRLYHRQTRTPDPGARAQMIYLANVLIGLHEQTRLQPEIREAMESAPATAADLGARRILWRWLGPLTRPFSRFARDLTCRAVTESLMVLTLPGPALLMLGRNLDRAHNELLATITLPELSQLAKRYEAADCGARDWSDLDQRMRYISKLFRCFHSDPSLLQAPFTAEQVRCMYAGSIPDGVL